MKEDLTKDYLEAIEANIAVHGAMADKYNEVEPHFRPESIARVSKVLDGLAAEGSGINALDLGCGTGFMINLLRNRASRIVGVDVTQAMLNRVDLSGPASIELINADTGSVSLPENHFQLATAYTFLDHLYDMVPTFENCYRALAPGGKFYADLSPNAYFWDSIRPLNVAGSYDPIIAREVAAVHLKGQEIEDQFGVSAETFVKAEHQKHTKGGLREETVEKLLRDAGFSHVTFVYHWFIGQAQLINDASLDRDERLAHAKIMHEYLTKALPISRHLFKYVGFIATK